MIQLKDAVQGATHVGQTVLWNDRGIVKDLAGAELTGRIVEQNHTTGRDIAGDLTITDAQNGYFRWDYDADDVADDGAFLVQFVATYTDELDDSETDDKSVPAKWRVHKAIQVDEA